MSGAQYGKGDPAEFQPVLIAEWPRGRDTIRVRLDRYNDRHTVEVRCWWTDTGGELKPGRAGLTVSVQHLPQLAHAFADALRKATELGLLEPESTAG
jgi:hypothetical protein